MSDEGCGIAGIMIVVVLGIGIFIGVCLGTYKDNRDWETKLLEKGFGEYRVENGNVKFRLKDD